MTRPPAWHEKAACSAPGTNPDWWFYPDQHGRRNATDTYYATAIDICSRCPVMLVCRATAVTHNEQHGVWGGMRMDNPRSRRAAAALPRAVAS
jgi:WhiB family redox-sensing transcriptional regulator